MDNPMQSEDTSDLEQLQSAYYELSVLAWDGTSSECAEFISGCLDILAEAKDMLKNKFTLDAVSEDYIFEYLYNNEILSTNYSSFDSALTKIEVHNDYGNYSIYTEGEDDIDIQDIMCQMESLVDDLSKL
jgi:hypothetical protein